MAENKYTSKWATDVQKAYKEGYINWQLDALKDEEYIQEKIKYVEEFEDENTRSL